MLRLRSATLLLIIFASASSLYAQIPSGASARSTPTGVEIEDTRALQVISRADDHFRKGKLKFDEGSRVQARDEFDKAIDVILESGFDVRANQRLQSYYLELVERIYRLENPDQSREKPIPQSGLLTQNNTVPASSSAVTTRQEQAVPQVGFREQKFEPSNLDELSKVVLTPEEKIVNPNASRPTVPCSLKLPESPELRGFKLGMDKAIVGNKLLGAFVLSVRGQAPDEFGQSTAHVLFSASQNLRNTFHGVAGLELGFLDNKLTSIELTYTSEVKWKNIDDFIAKVSEALKLPTTWRNENNGNLDVSDLTYFQSSYHRTLRCEGFSVEAELLTRPKLHIYDQSTDRIIEGRRTEMEERQRRAFKP